MPTVVPSSRKHVKLLPESVKTILVSVVKEDAFFREKINRTRGTSRFLQIDRQYDYLVSLLEECSTLKEDWDSYDSPVPSAEAMRSARRVVDKLYAELFLPARIVPSAEGGIALYFSEGDKTAYSEYRNSGEVILAMYDQEHDPIVIELKPTDADETRIIRSIRSFL